MINRRQTLQLTTGLGLTMLPTLSQADELELRALKQSLFGKRTPQAGRVELKVPALAENGNSVGLSVSIAPQRTSRPVQLVILSPGNPEPLIARFSFGPRGNAQQIDTRIRLATSQTL
ncbi:MAG: thiosulfate oxidation carrier protein SoxY, partial [Pseudomonadota bacterium]